jgi:hypothetical protein
MFILFFVSFFTISLHAEEGYYFQACFPSPELNQMAIKEIKFIQHSQDKVKVTQSCLDFYVFQNRQELYQKFLLTKFGANVKFDHSTSKSPSECNLEISIDTVADNNNNKGQLNNAITLKQEKIKSHKEQKIQVVVADGFNTTLQAEEDILSITCKKQAGSFKLDITSLSPSYKINTSRQVTPGQSIELADFVQKLQEEKRKVSLQQGLTHSNTTGRKVINIRIMAK